MDHVLNNINIKGLEGLTARAPHHVLSAIEGASHKSGVDFSYLVQQAAAESSFNPAIKAKTSSATGLYQFIDSTWLAMVERYGDDYGLETNGKSKGEILNMRKDPKAASFMAAAFASENEKTLNENWGGNVGATELYFAHFLGAGGASSFLKARDENPLQRAADVFPRAARANRNVFYDQDTGKARTLEQVYQFFDKKFQMKGDAGRTEIAQAALKDKPSRSYGAISRGLSDSIVMQKSQIMRLAAHNRYDHLSDLQFMATNSPIQKANTSPDAMPFFSLISKPVDLMLLTQTTPNKVIRDNG